MKGITATVAAIGAAAMLTACGASQPSPSAASPPAPVTSAAAASPSSSCVQQVVAWRATAGDKAFDKVPRIASAVATEAQAMNLTATAGDLDKIGALGAEMAQDPPPACLDPRHEWHKMTVALLDAAGESGGVASGDVAALRKVSTYSNRFNVATAALVKEIHQAES